MSKRTTSHEDFPSLHSGPTSQEPVRATVNRFDDNKSPRKPDWLLIFVSVLFLISLLIAWLVDVPGLLRQ